MTERVLWFAAGVALAYWYLCGRRAATSAADTGAADAELADAVGRESPVVHMTGAHLFESGLGQGGCSCG